METELKKYISAIRTIYEGIAWVPCSQRLPKNDQLKLVSICDRSGDTPYRYVTFGWYLEEAKCWIVESDKRTDVVAWMVLPNPFNSHGERRTE